MVWNPKAKRPEQLMGPATGIETVVKSDATNLATVSLGIYVGGAGDVSVLMLDGTTAVIPAVPAGTVLPIQVQRVNSTGTTATNMVSFN